MLGTHVVRGAWRLSSFGLPPLEFRAMAAGFASPASDGPSSSSSSSSSRLLRRGLATAAATLPENSAPAQDRASTLEQAQRAHRDLALDPDTVVTPNAKSASTARETKVEAQEHKPRHAGENPPGVPPQALKRAPETFNIKIPFPSLAERGAHYSAPIPVINPTLSSGSSPDTAQPSVKKPSPVLAVAGEERVHSPVTNAGLSAGEEEKLEAAYSKPRFAAILTEAGVPPSLAARAIVLYDKAHHHYYSLLPNGLFALVEPVPGAASTDGNGVFRFSPGNLPRELTAEERRGAVLLFALLFFSLFGTFLFETLFLANTANLAREAHHDAQEWRLEHPGEALPPDPRYMLESHTPEAPRAQIS